MGGYFDERPLRCTSSSRTLGWFPFSCSFFPHQTERGPLFMIKVVPIDMIKNNPFHVGIYTSPCSTRCDIVYEDYFLKTFLLKGRNDGRSNEAQQCACRTTLT